VNACGEGDRERHGQNEAAARKHIAEMADLARADAE